MPHLQGASLLSYTGKTFDGGVVITDPWGVTTYMGYLRCPAMASPIRPSVDSDGVVPPAVPGRRVTSSR